MSTHRAVTVPRTPVNVTRANTYISSNALEYEKNVRTRRAWIWESPGGRTGHGEARSVGLRHVVRLHRRAVFRGHVTAIVKRNVSLV